MNLPYCLLSPPRAGPKLRWMLLISLAAHVVAILAFVGRPPDSTRRIYFSPEAYTVDLVDLPAAPGEKSAAGRSAPGTSLWEGPGDLTSQAKAPVKRTHSMRIAPSSPSAAQKSPSVEETEIDPSGGSSAKSGAGQDHSGPGAAGAAGTSEANLRFSRYYRAVWDKIKNAWILPPYGGRIHTLEAIVVIKINRSGKILKIDFEKKSGDDNLDRSVLRAIKKSSPLPPLPVGFRENFLELGIRFRPGDRLP